MTATINKARPDVDESDAPAGALLVDAPDVPQTKVNDYSERIAQLTAVLERQKERRMYASNEGELVRLRSDILQLSNAIDLWKQAEAIPAEWTQFGTDTSQAWYFNLPPKIEGMWTKDMRVQATSYVFRTDDPFKIAACRDVVRRRQIEGLHEMEVGLAPAINENGVLFDWLKGEQLLRWNTSGTARSY